MICNHFLNLIVVLAYGQIDNDMQSFSQFYLPNVMIKDCNVIIDKLAFFDLSIKPKKKRMKRL